MKLFYKISAVLTCFLLLAGSASYATVWDCLWNDEITLAVKTVPLPSDAGIQVEISASIPPAVVSAWGDDCLPALRVDGSPNLNRGRPRGYRVAMQVQSQGHKIPLQVIQAGAGPLADRLGVFPTPIGRSIVIQQRSIMKQGFKQTSTKPVEYTITWWVDSQPARNISICLPDFKITDAQAPVLPKPDNIISDDIIEDIDNGVNEEPANNKVIQKVTLCEKANAQGKPVGSGYSFERGIASICLIMQINSPARSNISLKMLKASKAICLYEIETEGAGHYLIDLESTTTAGYSPGNYLITLNVNNRTEHTISFVIR